MIETITEFTGTLAGYLWNNGLTMLILVGTGLYLTIRLRFVQLTGFRHGWVLVSGKLSHDTDAGQVSHFQALSTALSATVGTGNIAGVATAISLGGPGALFWMWVTAFVGMATKFTESTLALKFREVDEDGTIAGGPMYTLLHGLKMKRTAAVFAAFALIASFGIGNLVQANSVVDGLTYIWPEFKAHGWMIGVVLSVMVGSVILGGVHRIAVVASAIVPFMVIIYVVSALAVLIQNAAEIPSALVTIFNLALNPWAAGGAAVGEAIHWGVARGLFSNEAGLGSSPMAHAAARTNEPVREGLVAMMEPFIDTIVICTLTGLMIITTGVSGWCCSEWRWGRCSSTTYSGPSASYAWERPGSRPRRVGATTWKANCSSSCTRACSSPLRPPGTMPNMFLTAPDIIVNTWVLNTGRLTMTSDSTASGVAGTDGTKRDSRSSVTGTSQRIVTRSL